MRLSLLVAVTAVFAVMAAQAYPNLNATSGILAVPTAVVVPAGDAMWAVDALFFDDTTFNGRFVFGLADQFELGAGVVLGEDEAFGLTGKYRLPAQIGGFNWALGASVITGDEVADGWQLFFTGTRDIPFGGDDTRLLGTIGVNFTDIDTASAVRPFVGAQLILPGGNTEIDGEFVFETGDFTDSITSLFLRHRFTDRIVGQVGFTNAYGFTGNADHELFLGVAFIERDITD